MIFLNFWAPPGRLLPAGLFSSAHLIMSAISFITIALALFFTRKLDHAKIKKLLRNLTLILCALEILKIIFTLAIGQFDDLNSYVPLYYCSITLYAGLLASFTKGWFRRTGEVFLTTGGIIGGLCFIIYPLTSVTIYPPFHFITLYSFFLHSIMVYIGLLLLISGYVRLRLHDIDHYFFIVFVVSVLAFIINITLHTNLMFLSQNYPGTPIEIVYNIFPGLIFPLVMFIGQASLPFYAVYLVYWIISKNKYKSKQ